MRARHHLSHGYACVELYLVRRILPYDSLVSLHRLRLVAQLTLQLSHEIPFAGTLFSAHFVFYDFAQIWDGFLIVACVYVVAGVGVVPLLAGLPVYGVALHVAYDVLGIVYPSLFEITFGQPRPCFAVDGRLCLIQTAHI